MQVSVGYKNTCAIRVSAILFRKEIHALKPFLSAMFVLVQEGDDNNGLECWGHAHHGQTTPPEVHFEAVSMGFQHACGVTGDGTMQCWGNSAYGAIEPPRDITPA